MNFSELAEAAVARAEAAGALTYTLICDIEDESPEGCFASGDPDQDFETVAAIWRSVDNGNDWAWCSVLVTCTAPGYYARGCDRLGCCSYDSEEDFRQGGYFEGMKAEARYYLARGIALELEEESKRI